MLLAPLAQAQAFPNRQVRLVVPDAIAFWDNRCVQHNPVSDYHGYRRIMQRITLRGDKPV